MYRCLQLAQNGVGRVAPNPMVGAVIVHDEKIIGEGYHRAYGGPHAEVNAISRVSQDDLLSRSTLYVNLEPCSHFGKTPPCVDLILSKKIPRVVIGQRDPNPKVAGRGIHKLRESGVEVIEGILEPKSLELNRRFNLFHTHNRPYIILKWAQSADGVMDIHRHTDTPEGVFWISRPQTKKWVHQLRSREAAILVGAQTVLNDDPKLDVREVAGRSPLRVVLGGATELRKDRNLFTDGRPTLVFQNPGPRVFSRESVERFEVSPDEDMITTALNALYHKKILSLLVEGGIWTLQRFIDLKLWDEAYIIMSDRYLGSGRLAPRMPEAPISTQKYGGDIIHRFLKP